jgi:hypothetical protein
MFRSPGGHHCPLAHRLPIYLRNPRASRDKAKTRASLAIAPPPPIVAPPAHGQKISSNRISASSLKTCPADLICCGTSIGVGVNTVTVAIDSIGEPTNEFRL